jgi:two-component system phosphate regulon sensor histidine kinase PhoR
LRRRRLLWQLYPSYLLVTLLALVAVAWYATGALRHFYFEETAIGLESRAHLLDTKACELLKAGETAVLDKWFKKLGAETSTRITLILPSGKVIADSDEEPSGMDNHGNRPEVVEALTEGRGIAVRFSSTLGSDMMYVAVPLKVDGEIGGILRTAMHLSSIQSALKDVYTKIALGGFVTAIVAAIVSLAVSRRIAGPFEEIKRGAERFARGELKTRLPRLRTSEEVDTLVESLNRMAAQLDQRIEDITRDRNEMEAILSSMVEGVLAVDKEERIITLNKAAGEMLGVDPVEASDRLIQEGIREFAVQKFVVTALSSSDPLEADITLQVEGERHLQAHGTLLHDEKGQAMGAVVVMNDITRLKKLESVRKEFVANVSHEIRTPITTMKGFVEALLDGAMADREDAQRFLGIIAKQADRLNTMIDDLLTLSRIERDTEMSQIAVERGELCEVMESALQACEVEAARRGVTLSLDCEKDLNVNVNGPLLERAVTNLIDNAVKYSEQHGTVEVRASREEAEIVITVADHGCGIPQEHIPRLFERFYRVDKSRSKELGGTGLGLAIVKHIAQAHGGSVGVESEVGRGSTFSIHLPAG